MTHARFKILKHVFLENEARLVFLNLALKFFFPKNRPLKVYGILNRFRFNHIQIVLCVFIPNKDDDDETDFVFFISLPARYDEREYGLNFLTGDSFSLNLGSSKVVLTFTSMDKNSSLRGCLHVKTRTGASLIPV